MFFSNIFHFIVTQTLIKAQFFVIEGAIVGKKNTHDDAGV